MLNPDMKGYGIYEFYRQEAEQQRDKPSSRVSTSSFSPRNSARMRCDGNLATGSLNSK